ncbi:MAG: MaoC family dehydratase [Deltaproteobacteria bacterium]|nr:MaoC family dehydratase [Deltaproteobacteria bacterium]
MSELRRRAIAGLKKGDSFVATRTFTRDETERFGDLTRDYNPVHYEPELARGKGLAGPILHGLLTGSLLCEVGGQLGWLASGMSFGFRRPVYFGDTITCRLTITELDEPTGRARAHVEYTNQHGERVLEAELAGYLPSPAERAVLAAIVARGDPTNELRGA